MRFTPCTTNMNVPAGSRWIPRGVCAKAPNERVDVDVADGQPDLLDQPSEEGVNSIHRRGPPVLHVELGETELDVFVDDPLDVVGEAPIARCGEEPLMRGTWNLPVHPQPEHRFGSGPPCIGSGLDGPEQLVGVEQGCAGNIPEHRRTPLPVAPGEHPPE